MRLDQELVKRGLCESRTEAQELIASGFVLVDNIICTKQIKQVSDVTKLEVTKRRDYVSRGGNKLYGALKEIYKNDESIGAFCLGKKALDIGSSTGGFTDCLLSFGVSVIDAVDVGTSQLHTKLKNDGRVASYENTDIRIFKASHFYDIVVADLSFISLHNVFSTIISFGGEGSSFFLLIKPQFEVGKGNTKKGIVKEENLVKEILTSYEQEANMLGLRDIKIFKSSIQGGDGNQEYFLYGMLSSYE